MKYVAKALVAIAFAFGAMWIGTTAADAACKSCKPGKTIVKTNTVYKNVYKHKRVTKYKDVRKTRYRVIPVTHVHTVTRLHNHTVYQHSRQRVARTVMGKGRVTYSASSVTGKSSSSNVSCGCK
jgi:hypothetical protein